MNVLKSKVAGVAVFLAAVGATRLWHTSQRSGGISYARAASAPTLAGARIGNGFQARNGETIRLRYTVKAERGTLLVCLNRRLHRRNIREREVVRSHNAGTGTWEMSVVAPRDDIYDVSLGAPLGDFQGEATATWTVG